MALILAKRFFAQMKLIPLAVSTATLIAGISPPVFARPYLYISTFSYSGSVSVCLTNAGQALKRSGFTNDFDRDMTGEKSGRVKAKIPSAAVVASIECDQSLGVTALAVSGLDNDLSYDKFKELFDASW